MAVALLVASCSDDAADDQPTDPAAAADAALTALASRPTTTTTLSNQTPAEDTSTEELQPFIEAPFFIPERGKRIIHYDLRTNDCFDREEALVSGRSQVITTWLPCDEPHRFEVFARVEYPAEHPSVYPGDDVMEDFALQSCYRQFEPWVDAVYETSELEITVITPDQTDFEDDLNHYRGIHCAVRRLDGELLVGTARSSGL